VARGLQHFAVNHNNMIVWKIRTTSRSTRALGRMARIGYAFNRKKMSSPATVFSDRNIRNIEIKYRTLSAFIDK